MKLWVLIGLLFGSLAWADANADYNQGVKSWTSLKAHQALPCDPSVDSQEYLTGHKTAVSVLILHGFSQNPQAMTEYIEFFKQYDVNILVPRLAHHFDVNLRSLDDAKKQEWLLQSQAAYEAAQNLGGHVVVVGYSLGGLLAARLALVPKNQKSLASLVLLSPALRLQGNIELGAAFASMGTKTGNELLNMAPPACSSATPYMSAAAGNEVVELVRSSDPAYPHADGTIYKNIFAPELDSSRPVFLSVVRNDEVVDSAQLEEMVTPIPSNGFITFLEFENLDVNRSAHSTFTLPGVSERILIPSLSHTLNHKSTKLFDQLSTFLKNWVGMAPAVG